MIIDNFFDPLNYLLISSEHSEKLQDIVFDPGNILKNDGVMISVIGYVIVFAALVTLYLFISNITRFLLNRQRKRLRSEGHQKADADKDELSLTGEVSAAIGTALYMHFAETHDYENTVLTIKKVQKAYSPWSSKIYNMTNFPNS